MELRQALQAGVRMLKDAGVEEAAADAAVLLCHAACCDRTYLYAHSDALLDEEARDSYFGLLERRSGGMPVQYITGICEFMSLEFEVGPGVLIPRQDTEILVEYVIDYCNKFSASLKHGDSLKHSDSMKHSDSLKILDLCTGSGCIAVSLAHFIRNAVVTAADISPKAIGIALANAKKNNVEQRLEFVETSLFEGMDGKSFDIIASNPPYIPSGDIPGLQREVRDFEPSGALDGGRDGLSFYRAIARQAPEFLKASGLLAVEVGIGQAHTVSKLLETGFTDISIIKDLAGIERVVAGIRN